MTSRWATQHRAALVGALVAGVLAAGLSPERAVATSPPVETQSAPSSVTFTDPGQHAWTVPAGVTRVDVVAVGGQGAKSEVRRGGRAARVVATLDVTPGQTLYAVVGTSAVGTTPGLNGGGAAGGSAAECVNTPGAGGGASDVRTVPEGQPGSAESRILVAGGGGGAGTLGTGEGDWFLTNGGHRSHGAGSAAVGGWAGVDGEGGEGGAGGSAETDGTSTTGGRGAVGVAGESSGCGGGGGGGYGGGGGGAAGAEGSPGGGGGGGGSLLPGGGPVGMAGRGEAPSVTFVSPGLPAREGPLAITSTQTFWPGDVGRGGVPYTNCPSSCRWIVGDANGPAPGSGTNYDLGYSSTQAWGSNALIDGDFGQSFVSVRPAADGALAAVGQPFVLAHFAHYNNPNRGDSPTALGMQTVVTVQPPAGPAVVFDLRGGKTPPLTFLETSNTVTPPCDPSIQRSSTPCDDIFHLETGWWDTTGGFHQVVPMTVVASGVTWHFDLLGWRTPAGSFEQRLVTEEQHVSQADIYAQITVDTNPTTSTLAIDDTAGAPVLRLTTTPVPQTGGTVTFTDDGEPIAGCTEVPVDATTGVTECSPGELAGVLGGSFSGGVGYAASAADPVEYESGQTTTSLQVSPDPSQLNEAVTLTATVTAAGAGQPSGTVAFHLDGAETPLATAPLVDGQATSAVLLPGGAHTVVASYGGDDTNLPSSSAPPTDVTVSCDRTISGHHRQALRVDAGTTCVLPGARIDGDIFVEPGASLNIEGASTRRMIVAASPEAIRICGSTVPGVRVRAATGFVLIGDPAHGCAANAVTGSIIALGNTGGLVIVDNTVEGAVVAHGNSGAGPLPGQEQPVVSGNHR